MLSRFALLALSLALFALPASASSADKDAELELLAQWMTGEFDTFAQVAADETAKTTYKHDRVVLKIVPVKIKGFHDQDSSKTFYFEQAQAATEDKPYRQGIYLLTRVNGQIINRSHRLKDAAKFTGAYANPKLLRAITPEMITAVEGCDITFTKASDTLYRGVMGEARTCKISSRGATHLVSHGELTPTATITLDQGRDDTGAHKWGPPAGVPGHIFIKRSAKK